jgi:hypothetical protein
MGPQGVQDAEIERSRRSLETFRFSPATANWTGPGRDITEPDRRAGHPALMRDGGDCVFPWNMQVLNASGDCP